MDDLIETMTKEEQQDFAGQLENQGKCTEIIGSSGNIT